MDDRTLSLVAIAPAVSSERNCVSQIESLRDRAEFRGRSKAARSHRHNMRARKRNQIHRNRRPQTALCVCALLGISRLEARPDLEARIAFDMAAGQAPYSYNVGELLGQAE
jgi:hypothetical protein